MRTVLRRAASEGRILVSHDKRTIPRHFASFLNEGNDSPGVLLVIPQDCFAPVRSRTPRFDLVDNTPEDWQDAITIIPF
jgi:hypothetical protein